MHSQEKPHAPDATQHNDAPVFHLTATELAERIRDGSLTAREVTEAHIQQIETINGRLNALAISLFDEAREQAAALDASLKSSGPVGALHGVPITIKEQFAVRGTDVTLGLTSFVGQPYADDGPLVSRLRQAGAVILGKGNVMQTLSGWESDNVVYGRTNNPWDAGRTPGGSSGGDAALVASGGSALALGGDYGGSIRIPAHFCGIHGFKPTAHRLTNEDTPGHFFDTGQESFIPQPGPLARSVADLNLAMQVLSVPHARPTRDLTPPVPWRDPNRLDVSQLSVGFFQQSDFYPVSPTIRRAVKEAAEALQAMGAHVEEVPAPDMAEALSLFLGYVTAGGPDTMKRILGGDTQHPAVKGLLMGASLPNPARPLAAAMMERQGQVYQANMVRQMGRRSAAALWQLNDRRTAMQAAFNDLLAQRNLDAVLCPPVSLPANRHGDSEHLVPAMVYAMIFNVLGNPAGVVSLTTVQPGEESDRPDSRDQSTRIARAVEQGSAGLPVGVQVVAPHWRDDVVLSVMGALEASSRQSGSYPTLPGGVL